jgi:putative cell wall-binding protein
MRRLLWVLAVLGVLVAACGAGDDDDGETKGRTTITVPTADGAAAEDGGGDAAVRRLAGDDRYATAAAVALDRWDHPSDVFLASGADPADALAGAYGSGLHSSPVLLTTRDELPPATIDALRSIAPTKVRVLGGSASISDAVVAEVEALGPKVIRHAGADRFATAVAVAQSEDASIIGTYKGRGHTALLANGRRPFDALAAGPLSAGQLFPILLTETDALPKVTADALGKLGIQHVLVLGGTGAVADAVLDALAARGITAERVAGATRAETAIAVAGIMEGLGYDASTIALTSATSVADALGAGPWGAPASPVLLCASADACGDATVAWAREHGPDEVVVIGGTAGVGDGAAEEVATDR